MVQVIDNNIIYKLLGNNWIKITGYWPSSLFACLWTKTETDSRLINTEKLYGKEHSYFLVGHNSLSGAGKLVPRCPLGWPITAQGWVYLAHSQPLV